ncbi:MAG: glycosyltransferase family 2 protein [Solirubrobacteraceae bacterium]
MISIVIPVKNGGSGFEYLLDAIARQDIAEAVEIVVVDSGSTDGSVALARQRGAIVREIPPAEFNHGASRNLGAALASGELLVFVSQDACPVDGRWLELLTAALRSDRDVAGVYGRQLANAGARPPEVYFLDFLYGPDARRQRAASAEQLNMDTTLFSNVNAAMRATTWQQFRFADDIIMSEDQEWCRRVLLAGHSVLYEPLAAVRHSHNYTLMSALRRFFDSGASAERAYLAGAAPSRGVLRAAALRYARGELGWLWRTGQVRWIPYTALYESVKLIGLTLGAHHRLLPMPAKRRLSALPSHWER